MSQGQPATENGHFELCAWGGHVGDALQQLLCKNELGSNRTTRIGVSKQSGVYGIHVTRYKLPICTLYNYLYCVVSQ